MRRLRIISVSLIAASCLCSCQLARLKRVRVAPEGVSVKVQTAEESRTVSQKSYVGSLEVSKEAVVNAPHGGVVGKIYVREGQKVAKGQVIAVIDSRTVRSGYEAAMAALSQAEDGYARASKVYESGSVTDVKMVEIRTQLAQARASAEALAWASCVRISTIFTSVTEPLSYTFDARAYPSSAWLRAAMAAS